MTKTAYGSVPLWLNLFAAGRNFAALVFIAGLLVALIDADVNYTMTPMEFLIFQVVLFGIDITMFAGGKLYGWVHRGKMATHLKEPTGTSQQERLNFLSVSNLKITLCRFNVHSFNNMLVNAFVFAWQIAFYCKYGTYYNFNQNQQPTFTDTSVSATAVQDDIIWTLYRALLLGMFLLQIQSVREFIGLFFSDYVGFVVKVRHSAPTGDVSGRNVMKKKAAAY